MPVEIKEDTEKAKLPFYKKWQAWAVVAVVVIAVVIGACMTGLAEKDSSSDSASVSSSAKSTASSISKSTSSSSSIATKPQSSPTPSNSAEQKIRAAVNKRISDKFTLTTVDSIAINENAGEGTTDSYIVLVNLTWNQTNSGSTSKSMLSMYSEDLAAYVAEECPNVDEIAVFWEVPYLKANAKVAYERKGQGMVLADQSWIGFK